MSGVVKIDGGRFHKRNIQLSPHAGLRPSGARVRTVLFDWIRSDLTGVRCLDLFAGSGILSFQAISWGAQSSLCVESVQQACQMIRSEAQRIGATELAVVHATLPCDIAGDFDICFMDPPFDQEALMHNMLGALEKGILVDGGILYLEWAEKLDCTGWKLLKYKKVGAVHMHLLEKV